MSVLLVAPGTAQSLGFGRRALWRPVSELTGDPGGAGPVPGNIGGLGAWWDAGSFSNLAGSDGTALSGWGQAVGEAQDKSGNSISLLPYSALAPAGLPIATPRVNGLLGGVGRIAGGSGTLAPARDPDSGYRTPTALVSSSGGWTLYLVWSRPNWRQNSGHDSLPITLAMIGSVPLLQADSAGGDGRLIFSPSSEPIVLVSTLERRHSHAVAVRFNANNTADVWLDGVPVAQSVSFSGASGSLTLLHDGTALGSAQCWFHEAAFWPRPLTDAETVVLAQCQSRWVLGARRGVTLLVNGQSNAINYSLNDGAAAILVQGIAWHLGALAYNVVATTGGSTAYTMQSGHGLYPAVGGLYPGSFLTNPGDGSDPSTWNLGADGFATQAVIESLGTADAADICAIHWPWNETDSLRNYSEKATFKAAVQRFLSLERGMLNGTASQLPLISWNAIPYGSNAGIQMHREVMWELSQDGASNVIIGNSQTSNSNPRGSSWDPNTGLWSGGDTAHRDSADNQRFACLAAPVVSRAILQASGGDSIKSIPAGIPATGGPRIGSATLQAPNQVLITVQHDCGTDLKVQLQASTGAGFAVMDGGSVANPGAVVQATACVRISETQLLLTLAQNLANSAEACLLFYPYGPVEIGRGNAVTDNFSDVAKPQNWDISSDLGSEWELDFPLAATTEPVALNAS